MGAYAKERYLDLMIFRRKQAEKDRGKDRQTDTKTDRSVHRQIDTKEADLEEAVDN